MSKALRDHGDISAETRELVKKTAAEMGYTPNHVARSLSTSQRSHTLGVVVPKIAHTFFSSVIEAVQEEATRRGYGIVLAVSSERAALERQHIERLLSMRVDGLLVSVSKEAPDLGDLRAGAHDGGPADLLRPADRGLGYGSVTVDDRAAARSGRRAHDRTGPPRDRPHRRNREVAIGRNGGRATTTRSAPTTFRSATT